MKTKLIFLPPAWAEHSNKYYITFRKNKIKTYNGLHPLRTEPNSNEKTNSEVLINSTFEFNKLDKLDRLQLNTKATHEIISQGLHNKVVGVSPYCVKLNWFQEFYINWHHKKYIIQSLDVKKSILTGFIGAVFGSLMTLFIQNLPNNSKQNEVTKQPNITDKRNIQTPKQDKIETDNVNISETDSLKRLKTDSIIDKIKSE